MRLRELAVLFLKLGTIGFGGPAAHLALLEDEVVARRGWLSREQFLDLLGATNLIPGPNSTEMAMHVGYLRAGRAGLVVAGACFILPAVLITLAFAMAYVRLGQLPQAHSLLAGIRPALLAFILSTIWRLGRTAVKEWRHALLGAGVIGAALLGLGEVRVLLGAALLGTLWLARPGTRPGTAAGILPLAWSGVAPTVGTPSAAGLFLFFLKIGSILYGSGYVLLAFLEEGLVHQHAWLTRAQLLDAVAIGQFTPGPILSTATFVGYLVLGPAGAVLATVGIFLPSFVFVALSGPLVPRLRRSPWTSAFLDAVNVSSLGLMAAVTAVLARDSVVNWQTALIALIAALAALRWRVGAGWLVLGGGAVGWVLIR